MNHNRNTSAFTRFARCADISNEHNVNYHKIKSRLSHALKKRSTANCTMTGKSDIMSSDNNKVRKHKSPPVWQVDIAQTGRVHSTNKPDKIPR